MEELNFNGFQHQGALRCGGSQQLPLGGSGELDLIGHSSNLPSSRSAPPIPTAFGQPLCALAILRADRPWRPGGGKRSPNRPGCPRGTSGDGPPSERLVLGVEDLVIDRDYRELRFPIEEE